MIGGGEIPKWLDADDRDLITFKIESADAKGFGVRAGQLGSVNDMLATEQNYFEQAYTFADGTFTEEQLATIQLLVCSAFKRGLVVREKITAIVTGSTEAMK